MTRDELDLMTTEALVDALARRFDHFGLCGIQAHSDQEAQAMIRWKGNAHTVAGLCQDLGYHALRDWRRASRPVEGDER